MLRSSEKFQIIQGIRFSVALGVLFGYQVILRNHSSSRL